MNIYSMSDLHLALSVPNKTMEVFGPTWKNYIYKIKTNWNKIVKNEDIVLIPGDISWAMNIKEIHEDFKFINELSGTKYISKGNHDYWYSTKSKINKFLNNYKTCNIIEKSFEVIKDKYICAGFKGFNFQLRDNCYQDQLDKKYTRLELLLEDIRTKYDYPILFNTHYPPIFEKNNKEILIFHNLFKKYNVIHCMYGHLHEDQHKAFIGIKDNIFYHLVAADYLNFKPKRIINL